MHDINVKKCKKYDSKTIKQRLNYDLIHKIDYIILGLKCHLLYHLL